MQVFAQMMEAGMFGFTGREHGIGRMTFSHTMVESDDKLEQACRGTVAVQLIPLPESTKEDHAPSAQVLPELEANPFQLPIEALSSLL